MRQLRLGDIDLTPASLNGVDKRMRCGLREGGLWGDQMTAATKLTKFSVVIRLFPGHFKIQHIIHAENRVAAEKRAESVYRKRVIEVVSITPSK